MSSNSPRLPVGFRQKSAFKVLNNQRVKTPPLAKYVTFIYDLLPANFSKFILKSRYREFFEGFAEFWLSKSFDVTITVGVGATFCFGVMNRLLRFDRRQVAKELYLDETSLSSPLKRSAFHWAIKNIDLIVTNSQAEIPYLMALLRLSQQQFKFIPWPNQLPVPELPEPAIGDYIFAGGRSFRDWITLLKSIEGTGIRTIVVASSSDLNCSFPIPPEITIFLDISHIDYVRLLKAARIVILPLKPTFRSIGQVALLEAMALGKPCIVADVLGMSDYIRSEVDGLLYKPEDPDDLKDKLIRLYSDEIKQELLSYENQKRVRKEFNVSAYSHSMLEALVRVCRIEVS